MKQIDLMIFDFDGTLVSSGADLTLAVNFTLNKLSLKPRTKQEIINFVGDGINKLIDRALGRDNLKYHAQAMTIFDDYYREHLLDNTKLYPHALEVLEKFADKKKIILTNKRHKYTLAIAQGLNIAKYFVEIVGADSTPFQKPDKRLMEYLMNKYGPEKKRTIIIGDGVNDIMLAKNSGILSCAYLNGLGNRQELLSLNADYYFESLMEINSLFS
jgi:phosphoglycolate phosphatase